MRRWYLYVLLLNCHSRHSFEYGSFFFFYCGRCGCCWCGVIHCFWSPHLEMLNQSSLMFVDTFLKWHAWNTNKSLCGNAHTHKFRSAYTASALHLVSCNKLNTQFICFERYEYWFKMFSQLFATKFEISFEIGICFKWFTDVTTPKYLEYLL